MNPAINNSLLKDLTEEQSAFVESKTSPVRFAAGDAIIRENSVGNSVFMLVKGQISIEKELIPLIEGFKSQPEDKKIIKIDESMNYFFGEMSLFDKDLKRTASIFAVSDVELLELSSANFEAILSERKDIGVVLLKNIGLKLSLLLDKSNVELSKLITAFTISLKL